jgi:predicted nucleic acid-binding protein
VSVFVIDAGVLIKWFIPEVQLAAARRWLESRHDYLAPDLVFPEAGNAIWKKVRCGELTVEEGQRLASDIARVAVEVVTTRGLLPDAHALAASANMTVYDAMYLVLAVRLDTQAITADDRLLRAARLHPMLARHVRAVDDFAP